MSPFALLSYMGGDGEGERAQCCSHLCFLRVLFGVLSFSVAGFGLHFLEVFIYVWEAFMLSCLLYFSLLVGVCFMARHPFRPYFFPGLL